MTYDLKIPDDIAVRVDAVAMGSTVEAMFKALGAPEADAKRSADVLIYADLRGIFINGPNDGNLVVRFSREESDQTTTIIAGSFLRLFTVLG